MRGTAAARCRALAPWLAAAVFVLVATAVCVRVLQMRLREVGALDLPALTLFGLTVLAVPSWALALAYRAHLREARQRSEVESLLAIMRDVHAAAGHRGGRGRPARARALARRRQRRRARAAHRGRPGAARPGGRPRARPQVALRRDDAPRAHAARGARVHGRRRPLEHAAGATHRPDRARPARRCRRRAARRYAHRRAARRRARRFVSACASAACSRRWARTPAARSRAARPHGRWPR